jgi:membrane-associated protease RseP (regulator of RpoE activity)
MAPRATTPREWAIALAGGLLLSAGLVTLLRGGGTPASRPASVPDAPPDAVPAATAPAPAPAASPPPPAAAVAAGPSGMVLTGLRAGRDGGMAIVRIGDRQVRLVPGRSLPGGFRLVRVEPARAILSGPAGDVVLAFADAAPATASAATPPGGDPTPWRLALSPVQDAAGAISGWRLDTLAGLAPLARAGLKPGDVLVAANGSPLISEEKIIELPQELAANGRVRLSYRRAGQLAEANVQP